MTGDDTPVFTRILQPSISDVLKTPNIDRIGREGVIFDNAFTQVAYCAPSRASPTLKELRNRLQQTMEATGDARLTDEYDKTPWVGPLKERRR